MERIGFAILCIAIIHAAESVTQNCTSAPCDLRCSGNEPCTQTCAATPCTTSCSSGISCNTKCPVGGCKKLSCDIDPKLGKECSLECRKNCDDMKCSSNICRPECQEDNCGITCSGNNCYLKCFGKNCQLNCKAVDCEAMCIGGGCKVKFGKGSSGLLACPGGRCDFLCAKGSTCVLGLCPNCTGPTYVDDPFYSSTTAVKSIRFLLFSVAMLALVSLLA